MSDKPDFKAAGMAANNIVIMATTIVKLSNAAKLGNGLALTHNEVKALMFALQVFRDEYKEHRPTKTGRLRTG